jgi:ABC-2 type transport system permease protein
MTAPAPASTFSDVAGPGPAPAAAAAKLTFLRALRGEWIKLTTVSSTWWSIAITIVLTVGMSALIAFTAEGMPAIQAVILPIQFAMLLAGILGAISVTGEYSTGMIRSTLIANPVRGSVLAAKVLAVAILMFVSSLLMFGTSALIVSAVMSPGIDWADATTSTLPLVLSALTMSVIAVIGASLGFVIRAGAGAIAAVVGLLFVAPIAASLFSLAGESLRWIVDASRYLPSEAARGAILEGGALEQPVSWGALAGWMVAGLVGAWVSLRGRDA